MYRRSQDDEAQRITGQAAEWLRVMQRDPSAEESAAFTTWVKLSQEHLKEFLVVSMLDRELTNVDPEKKFDVEKLLVKVKDNVESLPERATDRPRVYRRSLHRNWPWAGRWAAAVAVLTTSLSILAWFKWGPPAGERFATVTSEQRTIRLDDGSVVELNARSKLSVHYSVESRELELREGEALFKVAPDPARPFRVRSGTAMIQALGTQFNVNRRSSGTTVAVIEGRVRILSDQNSAARPADFSAGQETKIALDGQMSDPKVTDVSVATSWKQRRLHFQAEPLAEIVEEFNRYTEVQIEVADDAARARHFNGVFDADDPRSFLEFLRLSGSLEVTQEGRRIVVRTR